MSFNESVLTFESRQELARQTYKLAEPIYMKMREGFNEAFQSAASYEQDTLIMSVNGYSRFFEHLKTAYRDVKVITSMIINYRSALVLNFDKRILTELERDLFIPELFTADKTSQPGLMQLTNSGVGATLTTDTVNALRPFDILAAYLFLYNAKFFVYNLDIKLYPDEDKK